MRVRFNKAAAISLVAFAFGLLTARADMQTWSTRTGDWFVHNGMTITINKNLYKCDLRNELEKRGAVVGGSHNFSGLLSDELFDEHPGYFPLIDGKRRKQMVKGNDRWPQPCMSNPKFADIMVTAINKDLDLSPKGVPGYATYPTKAGISIPGLKKDCLKIWRAATWKLGIKFVVYNV